MTATASVHAVGLAALDQAYDLLIGIGRRALAEREVQTERTVATDTDGDCRPLVGIAPTQHEDRATRPRNLGAAFEEDATRDVVTTRDN